MAEAQKPIAFCEHLQLSSLGVQPGSISFQVRRDIGLRMLLILTFGFLSPLGARYMNHLDLTGQLILACRL